MQAVLSQINEQNFAENKDKLKELLYSMQKNAAHCDGSLERNIRRLAALTNVMETRPERPAGWTIPSPRVEDY